MSRKLLLGLAVMVAASLAACTASGKSPAKTPSSESPAPSPNATALRPPTDPQVLIVELGKQAPQLPSKAPCPVKGGKWRYNGGPEPGEGPGIHVNINHVVETNLDGDAVPEIVAHLSCIESGFGHPFDEFVTAFERDASGAFTALDAVMLVQPESVVAVAARPSGGVVLTFTHDRTGPGYDDSDLRTQKREFVWEAGAFRQVTGGTSIPLLPRADLAMTKVTHTRTPGNGDNCSFTFTVTMSNKGPVMSGPVLIAFWTETTAYTGVNQDAHPPMAVGQTADIQAKVDLPCSTAKATVFSFTGGADPKFDNNSKSVSLSG